MDSLEALPDDEEMQQLRLEFLIDHGEMEASEEALKRMASRLANEGRINRARKVAMKFISRQKISTRHPTKLVTEPDVIAAFRTDLFLCHPCQHGDPC